MDKNHYQGTRRDYRISVKYVVQMQYILEYGYIQHNSKHVTILEFNKLSCLRMAAVYCDYGVRRKTVAKLLHSRPRVHQPSYTILPLHRSHGDKLNPRLHSLCRPHTALYSACLRLLICHSLMAFCSHHGRRLGIVVGKLYGTVSDPGCTVHHGRHIQHTTNRLVYTSWGRSLQTSSDDHCISWRRQAMRVPAAAYQAKIVSQ